LEIWFKKFENLAILFGTLFAFVAFAASYELIKNI